MALPYVLIAAVLPQHDSIVLDGKLLLRGKLPGFHKMWYDACHAAKARGGSFKGMSMSFQVDIEPMLVACSQVSG